MADWLGCAALPHHFSSQNESMLTAIVVIFIVGYLAIALEHPIHVNKAATAIVTGVVCWTLYAIGYESLVPEGPFQEWAAKHAVHDAGHLPAKLEFLLESQLAHCFVETAGILFFLIGAMTIVELIDAHEGFSIVTQQVKARNKVALIWVISWVAFFLSAVLDNLTTTIVMVSVVRKLVPDREIRLLYVGMVVIAANAGGAWTVIGDVTTTMLWVKNKIGVWEVMRDLVAPSLACLLVPLLVISRQLKGDLPSVDENTIHTDDERNVATWHKVLFLSLGVGGLLSVPLFKAYTHLPPYMGMMLSLGVLWLTSEFTSHTMDEKTKSSTGVLAALKRVDMSSILFFFGILLAVGALGGMEILKSIANSLQNAIGNQSIIAVIIGLVSAVVDNVPLVAAGIEMYADTPMNDSFWMMLAYCAGTGGSCLIIGSAAGVAAMGLEKIDFLWYLKRIAPLALAGYFAGVVVYLIQSRVFG